MSNKKVWFITGAGRGVGVRFRQGRPGAKQLEFWKAQNGQQSGDPAKLARALVLIASQEPPPRRFIAGADAIATAEQKVADLKAQIDAERDLSTSLALDRAPAARSI